MTEAHMIRQILVEHSEALQKVRELESRNAELAAELIRLYGLIDDLQEQVS